MGRKEFFDHLAKEWDSNAPSDKKNIIKSIVDMVCISKGEKVLDIGCGTGILFPLLKSKTGKKGDIYGVDFSSEMLKAAGQKFGNEYPLVKASAEKMPFENSYFDTSICFSCFPHFEDKQSALLEIYRVLKTKGKIVIAHADSREKINSLHSEIGGEVKNDRIPSIEKMKEMLEKAGFTNISIKDDEKLYFACAEKI